MARAYTYSENGGGVPLELEIAWRCNDLGAAAVLGDEVSARVIRRVTLANNVYRAYLSRKQYRDANGNENWAEWASKHPDLSRIVSTAAQAANTDE